MSDKREAAPKATDGRTHEALVEDQFGARAEAYLASSVHARGEDLAAMVALMQRRDDAHVLDLGCGGGHVAFGVAPHVAEVVACDLTPRMLETVARDAKARGLTNLSVQQGRAESLPFPDGHFDVVLSRFSAHHWHDLDAGLREAARVLRPGGLLAIADTVTSEVAMIDSFFQAVELLRDPSHVRNHSRSEWEAAIGRTGLRPGPVAMFRTPLDFAAWVERMQTPPLQVEAIRTLQRTVSDRVTAHFDTQPDGSYVIDVALFQAEKRG